MENKVVFKRYGKLFIFLAFIFGVLLYAVNMYELKSYEETVNGKMAAMIEQVKKKYPEISDKEILDILNSEVFKENYMQKYGYTINDDVFLKSMENKGIKFIILETCIYFFAVIVLISVILGYNHKKDKEIENVLKIIEQINKKNYELKIKDYDEDELSILKSEIYKTTLMLKEAAENSLEDKFLVKKSLSDISHQLKTPLTSILIMIDNIIDDEEMDALVKNEFLRDIKREIVKINFLVQSILKLSKFESNTINFNVKDVSLRRIIEDAIQNVSVLSDLKNISIKFEIENDVSIKCDHNWQVEAITNILKNALEHSNDGSKVQIFVEENNVYKSVVIKDFGTGIDKEDLEHIFERFYKSKNSNKDSIGIGLELSKKIIEASNGSISVKSSVNEGTTFTIKYFRN